MQKDYKIEELKMIEKHEGEMEINEKNINLLNDENKFKFGHLCVKHVFHNVKSVVFQAFKDSEEKRPIEAVELVEKWLNDPKSVNVEELEGAAWAASAASAARAANAARAAEKKWQEKLLDYLLKQQNMQKDYKFEDFQNGEVVRVKTFEECMEFEKDEFFKSSNSENKPKSSQIFQLVKCGKVIQTFPTLEECEELFKKEFPNLQKGEVLTISQVLKVAKLSVSVENLNDSQNLKDEKVEKFKVGDNVKFIDGCGYEQSGTIVELFTERGREIVGVEDSVGLCFRRETTQIVKIS